jgi:hypothetical protein
VIAFSDMKVINAIGLAVGDLGNNGIENNEIHPLDQGKNVKKIFSQKRKFFSIPGPSNSLLKMEFGRKFDKNR